MANIFSNIVVTHDKETDSENNEFEKEDEQTICEICKRQFSKYTCPRCNIRYCSLNCYKNEQHNTCTENFYKSSIIEEIKSKNMGDEEKQKMVELLQRFEREGDEMAAEELMDDTDEEVENNDDLFERFKNLDIGSASFETIWSHLNAREREKIEQEFEKVSRTGKMGNLTAEIASEIKLWQPWWATNQDETIKSTKIQSLDEMEETREPSILENIQPLEELTKTPPDPAIVFHLVNILFAYAHTCRYLNGELFEDSQETCHILLDLSSSLSSKTTFVYENVSEAISVNLRSIAEHSKHTQSPEFTITVLKDLMDILTSANNVLIALTDLYNLFHNINSNSMSVDPSLTQKNRLSREERKQAFFTEKKIYFYLVYANSVLKENTELLEGLKYAVELDRHTRRREFQEFCKGKGIMERYLKSGKKEHAKDNLIEVLPYQPASKK
ncbi:8727_t:CDS:2 [Ambispora leptoticha]|uniref:8727_t:CDS:1 n=1 Tax=Ambispora leptoticha TaxID=144679 RepID=A0A9N8V610_9GLOM|nr:8727_t:CDS:2 [Ambispora leptoticha]